LLEQDEVRRMNEQIAPRPGEPHLTVIVDRKAIVRSTGRCPGS
jgi:hypothetical protein